MAEELWTFNELSELTGTPISTVRRWFWRGDLKAELIGNTYIIRQSQWEKFRAAYNDKNSIKPISKETATNAYNDRNIRERSVRANQSEARSRAATTAQSGWRSDDW